MWKGPKKDAQFSLYTAILHFVCIGPCCPFSTQFYHLKKQKLISQNMQLCSLATLPIWCMFYIYCCCCCLVVKSCSTLRDPTWTRARQALLSSTASRSWVKFMLVASMTLSNHLILCCPLLLLPSLFPNIRVFSRESSHEMAKVLEPHLQDLSFQWTLRVDFLQNG